MIMSFLQDHAAVRPEAPGFVELSVVVLNHDVEVEGRMLPSGATGVVVHAYSDGVGYEVEFEEPFHAVVTLEATDLRV